MVISKTLKQLMKVLLVVFMSLTVIVPEGLTVVDAANESLSIDKEVYEIGDPVYTTATSTDEDAWVGFYLENASASIYWYYVKDHNGETVNIFDTVLNDGSWEGWNFKAGNYTVKLVLSDGTTINKDLKIVKGDTPEGITAEKSSFGATDPVVVNVVCHEYDTPWIEVVEKDAGRVGNWFYCNLRNGLDIDLRMYTGYDFESGKTYVAKLYKNDAGTFVDSVEFTAEPVAHEISVDVAPESDNISRYKYGQSVFVTAASGNAKAEVRLYDYNSGDEHGYGADGTNPPYAKFKVHETEMPVDIIALAKENGFDILPGKYRRYLILPTPENPNDITGFYMSRIEVLVTYYDDDEHIAAGWQLNEDKTAATITFKRVDDETQTVTYNTISTTNL